MPHIQLSKVTAVLRDGIDFFLHRAVVDAQVSQLAGNAFDELFQSGVELRLRTNTQFLQVREKTILFRLHLAEMHKVCAC